MPGFARARVVVSHVAARNIWQQKECSRHPRPLAFLVSPQTAANYAFIFLHPFILRVLQDELLRPEVLREQGSERKVRT